MLYLRSFNRFILISLALLGLSVSSAHAATYKVVGNELQGIDGLIVDSILYDVTFHDGTCATVYSDCNELSDFTFNTGAKADLATQAIVDAFTTLGGIYDAQPALARGIEHPSKAQFWTPWGFRSGGYIWSDIAENLISQNFNYCGAGGCSLTFSYDQTDYDFRAWAKWSPSAVPVPAAVWLFGTVLIGLVGFSKRKSKVSV